MNKKKQKEKLENKKINKGIILFILSATVGAFGPPTIKKLTEEFTIDYYNIVFYFLLFGGLSMIPFSIDDFRTYNKSNAFTKEIVTKLFLIGFFMPITYFCYISAINIRSATETVPIVRLDVFFVIVLSIIFLNESVKSWSKLIFSGFICFIGTIIFLDISMKTFVSELTSSFICFALTSALLIAIQEIIRRKIQESKTIKNETIISATMIIGAIFVFFCQKLLGYNIVIPKYTEMLWMLFLGVITISFAVYLNLKAYEVAGNVGKLYVFTFLRPILVAIISFIWLGERNFTYENLVVGFFLIITGIYFAEKLLIKRKEK